MPYAEGTTVTPDRSRSEIESTLRRYGADAFSYGWEGERAVLTFRAGGRIIRFDLRMPALSEFTLTPTGMSRSTSAAHSAHEKAIRQRWRALALVIKAKLEAVESGITAFEEEFLAHIVLPDATTVGDFIRPQLEDIYATGEMPELLPTTRALPRGDT